MDLQTGVNVFQRWLIAHGIVANGGVLDVDMLTLTVAGWKFVCSEPTCRFDTLESRWRQAGGVQVAWKMNIVTIAAPSPSVAIPKPNKPAICPCGIVISSGRCDYHK